MSGKFKDHLGNEYASFVSMVEHYGMKAIIVQARLSRGMTLEQALTMAVENYKEDKVFKDPLGNTFKTVSRMALYHKINVKTLTKRLKSGMSIAESLTKEVVNYSKGKPCKDHLGNTFSSQKLMLEHYNIKTSTLVSRLKRGLSLEQALTDRVGVPLRDEPCTDHKGNSFESMKAMADYYNVPVIKVARGLNEGIGLEVLLERGKKIRTTIMSKKHKDHLGNEFGSVRLMAEHWGIKANTLVSRLNVGVPLEQALTQDISNGRGIACTDHIGNEFESQRAMAEHWGISLSTLVARLKRGLSLEKALTDCVSNRTKGKPCKDHLGNEYPSKMALAKQYHISVSTFEQRLKAGATLEEALTRSSEFTKCADHLGNIYPNQKAMAEFYGISFSILKNRRKAGATLEEALTRERSSTKGLTCKDHLGNEYKSFKAMAEHYNINHVTVKARLDKGIALREALTLELMSDFKNRVCTDHLGNKFTGFVAMCEHYDKPSESVIERIKQGISLEEALTMSYNKNTTKRGKLTATDHLGNLYDDREAMLEFYKIPAYIFNKRMRSGWSLEEALTFTIVDKQTPCKDHLENEYATYCDMASAYKLDVEILLRRLLAGWSLERALTLTASAK